MKKRLLLSAVLMLCIGMAYAQSTAYTYVKQNGATVEADGTALFDVSSTPAVMSFDDDDNAIMKIGKVTVAKIRANERNIDLETGLAAGVLAADFDNQSGSTNLSVTVSASDADATLGYLTLYSPFQLKISENNDNVKIFASTYDETNQVLKCNNSTAVAASTILPACTSLILMNAGTVKFTMSSESTDDITESIEGYAVKMPLPETNGKKIYTLGHATKDKSKFGFFKYVNKKTLAAGKAFLVAADLDEARPEDETTSSAKYIQFDFTENTPTAISNVNTVSDLNGKYIENGRVVIVKDGQKYNLTGQEVK